MASSATIRIVSYGGSKIEYTGTGVTLPAITKNSGNESNYILTITGAGNGTLKVSHYTDPSQFIEYRVTVLKSAIEGNTGVTLTASGSQTATVTVTSGLGGNATVSSWNGGNLIITVTPNLLAPTLSSASGSVTNITGSNVRIFTVSAVGGGITIKSNSNAAVATANLNQSNRTVTVTSKKAGSTVITVANASDVIQNRYLLVQCNRNQLQRSGNQQYYQLLRGSRYGWQSDLRRIEPAAKQHLSQWQACPFPQRTIRYDRRK